MERLVINKQTFDDLIRQHKSARDRSKRFPNSFRHEFNAGKVEALRELEEAALIESNQ